ncbi:uncharacterized protein LOC110596169 isoform X2 [Carlito syrichta]|uniref:Uncharacterized protein LOC110596169 isoform X2 n=1 Tax=Carlito syrichta TaxID=1868482 RepID=A0A3Q0E474_CARSF|nr:uncharacterized protein LOC110596169 isoform X2 [Carlito syrichta]
MKKMNLSPKGIEGGEDEISEDKDNGGRDEVVLPQKIGKKDTTVPGKKVGGKKSLAPVFADKLISPSSKGSTWAKLAQDRRNVKLEDRENHEENEYKTKSIKKTPGKRKKEMAKQTASPGNKKQKFGDLKKVGAISGLKKKECQVEKNEHFRHILLFEFNRGVKAAEAARNICAVYGENAIGESTARKWFCRFKEGHFDLSDSPRSGRPSGFDEDRLNAVLREDPCQSTRELANVMNCDQSTIVRHLHSLGKRKSAANLCIPPVTCLICKTVLSSNYHRYPRLTKEAVEEQRSEVTSQSHTAREWQSEDLSPRLGFQNLCFNRELRHLP